MNDFRRSTVGYFNKNNETPHIYAILVGLLFMSGLVLPWLLPNIITQVFKPLSIYVLITFILYWRVRLEIKTNQVLAIFSILCYFAALVGHQVTTSSVIEFVSTALYMLMFLFTTIVNFKMNDIKFILKCTFYASLVFAIISMVSNPMMGSDIKRSSMNFLYTNINGNLIPYAILPGFVVGLQVLVYGTTHKKVRVTIALLIMLYSIFLPATRGAFLVLLLILFFTFYEYIKAFVQKKKFFRLLMFTSFLIVLVNIFEFILPGSVSGRLLNINSYSDTSGRTMIYSVAWDIARQNLLLGSGFSEWSSNYTFAVHNMYLELLVSTGILGTFLVVAIVINSIVIMKNNILYAILSISIVESLVETSGAYTFWIPIILSTIIINYCKRENCSVKQFYKRFD